MKISVIIPTYKPQQYLFDCLLSLKNQTFSKNEFEILLILNGPRDPFFQIISDFIDENLRDCNIHFLQTDIQGVSNARNIGLEKAQGDYVTFIDDDDYVSDSFLEKLYEKATRHTIVLCRPEAFIDGKDELLNDYSKSKIFEKYSSQCNLPIGKVRKFFSIPSMKLIPREIIGDRRFDLRFKNGEDSLFMFSISDRIQNICFSNNEAIYYRRFRENSAFTSKKSRKYLLVNNWNMIKEYTRIYIHNMRGYKLSFYITRILGAIRSMI